MQFQFGKRQCNRRQTNKEVIGPFSSSEMTERLGDHWVPSRRFGVRQGGKIRAVDDFSQYLINSAVTCHEKLDLEGIDSICATARFFLVHKPMKAFGRFLTKVEPNAATWLRPGKGDVPLTFSADAWT